MKKIFYLLLLATLPAISQVKISQLPNAGSLTGSEIFETVQGGSSKKVNLNALKLFFLPLYSLTTPAVLQDSSGILSWIPKSTLGGGGGGSYVTTNTNQTVGGLKTFTSDLTIGLGANLKIVGSYGTDIIIGTGIGRTFNFDPNGGGTLATQAWVNQLTFLPTQSGNSGKYLQTNGTSLSWATASGGSGVTYNNIYKTANYTAVVLDKYIECSGTFTITLPTAIGNTNTEINVKNTGTGNITIVTTSSQTIDGSVNKILTIQNQSQKYISNGTNWKIY